jgi:AcrR family transcriptional regulator
MSPRSEAQYEQLRDQSRAKIVQSALELFATNGYERTSIKLIAAKAGVAQGLLYNYFAGKEELLRAIFLQSMEQVRASFVLPADDGEPLVWLEHYIRGCFVLLREHLNFWRLGYAVRGQPEAMAQLAPVVGAWTEEIRSTLEQYFIALGTAQPAIDGALLFAQIDGISQHYALDPEHYPLDAVVDRLVERYCAGDERRKRESDDQPAGS